MKKIVLNYLSLIHYRQSLFEMLFASGKIDFKIICGKDSPYPNMRNFSPKDLKKVKYIKNIYMSFGVNKLVWQSKILFSTLKERPDVIVLLGFNPLIVSSIFVFLFLKLFNKKVVWWGHATLGAQGSLGILFRVFFYKASDGIFVYDQKGKDRLILKGIDEKKITVLNNCLNLEDYGYHVYGEQIYKKKLRNINEKTMIVFSGRITNRKKIDVLLEAIKIILNSGINIECNIIGDGPELNNLIFLSKKLNIVENIFFRGNLYGKDVSQYFLDSDINVVPDAVGLSIIHGLSYGLPLITCNVSSNHGPEISVLKPGINGDFYKANDPNSLADKIIKWRNKIIMDRINIKRKCIDSIAKTHTPEYMRNRFIDFVNKI